MLVIPFLRKKEKRKDFLAFFSLTIQNFYLKHFFAAVCSLVLKIVKFWLSKVSYSIPTLVDTPLSNPRNINVE